MVERRYLREHFIRRFTERTKQVLSWLRQRHAKFPNTTLNRSGGLRGTKAYPYLVQDHNATSQQRNACPCFPVLYLGDVFGYKTLRVFRFSKNLISGASRNVSHETFCLLFSCHALPVDRRLLHPSESDWGRYGSTEIGR
jgi:hypothetical protein